MHLVSKEGVQPNDSNLRAIAKCAPPQSYMEIWALLGLVGHYWQFIKGFMHIAQPLTGFLSGEDASRKSEKMLLLEDALRAFDALKQACMSSPVLAFADYTKKFLLEANASKEGLGAVLSQKQTDGQYHPVAYGSWPLWLMKKLPFHQTGVPGTKMEHFKEYLPYQPFLMRADNNPLTYIWQHLTSTTLATNGWEP